MTKINPDHESNHDTVCQNMRYIYKLFEKDDNVEGMRLANKVFGHAKSMDEKLKYYKNTYEPNVPSNHSRKMRDGLVFRDGFWVYPHDLNGAKREIEIFNNIPKHVFYEGYSRIYLPDLRLGVLFELLFLSHGHYNCHVYTNHDIDSCLAAKNNISDKTVIFDGDFSEETLSILVNTDLSKDDVLSIIDSGADFIIDLKTSEKLGLYEHLISSKFITEWIHSEVDRHYATFVFGNRC